MSIMLDPEEVDDGYFTPVASTSLASIFKDDSSNNAAINPSLKYRPPQPKKTENSNKLDDSASQCVFSCSIIAYEWVQGTHKCKGKVGFAMIRIVKTGLCKIILYSPDKSTLSCTTIMPQLEVTLKGAMISLYDDHKKYWGLCFNDKIIEEVKGQLKKENVIVNNYVSPESKSDMENLDSDEAIDEADSRIMIEDKTLTSRNDKASILSRIANVGHAILPSLPESPVKKSSVDILNIPEKHDAKNKLNELSDMSSERASLNNMTMQDQEFSKSIGIQANKNNTEESNILSNSITQNAQTSVTSLPLVNNQIFTYVNGYMVPLHVQVPVINNVEYAGTSADFELIIQKLTHLKGVVSSMEMKNHFQNNATENVQPCSCKIQELQNDMTIEKAANDKLLKNISELEQLLKEKDDVILKLQNELKNEITKSSNTISDQSQNINDLNVIIEKSEQDLSMKNEELRQMIPKKAADSLLANTVKSLMNDTFRSLASNFDGEVNYMGNNVKAILAAVIKKNTVETLSNLFSNHGIIDISAKTSD